MTQFSTESQTCGYCGHVRPPETLAPEWQCPACNTAYAKAHLRRENEQFPRRSESGHALPAADKANSANFVFPGWLWKTGLLLATIFVVSRFVSIGSIDSIGSTEKNQPPPPAVVAPAGEVWVFTREGCGYCKKLKAFLAEKRYVYTEFNIENDANAKAMYAKLEAPGVPITLVGDKEIIGYVPSEIEAAIKNSQK